MMASFDYTFGLQRLHKREFSIPNTSGSTFLAKPLWLLTAAGALLAATSWTAGDGGGWRLSSASSGKFSVPALSGEVAGVAAADASFSVGKATLSSASGGAAVSITGIWGSGSGSGSGSGWGWPEAAARRAILPSRSRRLALPRPPPPPFLFLPSSPLAIWSSKASMAWWMSSRLADESHRCQ